MCGRGGGGLRRGARWVGGSGDVAMASVGSGEHREGLG